MKLLTRESTFAVMLTNELCFALVRAVTSYDSYKTQVGTFSSQSVLTRCVCYNNLS